MSADKVDYQFPVQRTQPEIWTLTLSRYQRDNLLWLLQLVGGWPWPMAGDRATDPFTMANTGDWVGEVTAQLGTSEWIDGKHVPRYDPRGTNRTTEDVRASIERWRR